MRLSSFAPVLTVVLLGLPPAAAHPGGHGRPAPGRGPLSGQHRYRLPDGRSLEGFLLYVREGNVAIERRNGGVVHLPMAELTREDRAYVQSREAKVLRLNRMNVTDRPLTSPTSSSTSAPRPWLPLAGVGLLAAGVTAAGAFLQRKGFGRTGLATLAAGSVVVLLAACGGSGGASAAAASSTPGGSSGGSVPANDPAVMSAAFAPFSSHLHTHADSQWFYVESDGMPDHNLMVGITSWQQQVPTPQPYTGTNAWQIPLKPVLATTPISAKTALYTGAIALAVNGVPIFNALNNRGDDAYLYGELDQWGGHAGRADDYHYHIAPLHLQPTVGVGKAIAYALDGFPLYGETEPDGSAVKALDTLNGHFDATGGYHYHGTRTYPYINGGMRGVVQVSGDQIVPQPHTSPFRPWLTPLAGAVITGFEVQAPGTYRLTFAQSGGTGTVTYVLSSGTVAFTFADPDGTVRTATYTR